jgi:hypothetical protein
MDEIELLALLRPGAVGRNKRVHEGLEVGPPPLRECIANVPIIVDTFASKLRSYWSQSFVQPSLEAIDLIVFG